MNKQTLEAIDKARQTFEANLQTLSPGAKVEITLYKEENESMPEELGWIKNIGTKFGCEWYTSSPIGIGHTAVFVK